MDQDQPHEDVMSGRMSRRGLLSAAAGAAAVGAAGFPAARAEEQRKDQDAATGPAVEEGRIKQSVCKWCYKNIPLEKMCRAAAKMGLKSVELLDPAELPVVQEHGLTCAMVNSHGITKGLNREANWDHCLSKIREGIEAAAEHGCPSVITFSGNRDGLDDRTGLKNCAAALRKITPLAEEKGVTICMELLNSRVNHPDYMCDHTDWGVELCQRVGSDRFKLLYDIYHMQIMEGDIIRHIRDHHPYFGHYHTAGNPGRHEMDETQEMYYPPIVRAIIETGYDGYLGQEFLPTGDPLASLREMVRLCDV